MPRGHRNDGLASFPHMANSRGLHQAGNGLPPSVHLSIFCSTNVLSSCLVPGITPGPGHVTHSPNLLSALN